MEQLRQYGLGLILTVIVIVALWVVMSVRMPASTPSPPDNERDVAIRAVRYLHKKNGGLAMETACQMYIRGCALYGSWRAFPTANERVEVDVPIKIASGRKAVANWSYAPSFPAYPPVAVNDTARQFEQLLNKLDQFIEQCPDDDKQCFERDRVKADCNFVGGVFRDDHCVFRAGNLEAVW